MSYTINLTKINRYKNNLKAWTSQDTVLLSGCDTWIEKAKVKPEEILTWITFSNMLQKLFLLQFAIASTVSFGKYFLLSFRCFYRIGEGNGTSLTYSLRFAFNFLKFEANVIYMYVHVFHIISELLLIDCIVYLLAYFV